MIKLGWIDYLNLYPLKVEILKRLSNDVQLIPGHPAEVNKWLEQQEVVAAPCSSLCLLKSDVAKVALPLGVVSRGPVRSVYFGFTHEHSHIYAWLLERRIKVAETSKQLVTKGFKGRQFAAELLRMTSQVKVPFDLAHFPPLYFTQNSATSVALGRIFLRLWLGEEFFNGLLFRALRQHQHRESFHHNALVELLIGDEALERKPKFSHIFDFGEIWREMTGEPFVFAIWQAHTTLSQKHKSLILEAAEIAENFMRLEPCRYQESLNSPLDDRGSPIDLPDYWSKIEYHVGIDAQKSFIRFVSLAALLDPSAQDFVLQEKLIKWDLEGNI